MDYVTLPLSAQTAYAQLFDAVLASETERSVASLSGEFSTKQIKGRSYWYYSYRQGTGVRQIYVGPDSEQVRALVERKRSDPDHGTLADLARAYVALRGTACLPKHLRLIRRLTDFGFFRNGGLLVGTHAFLAYANVLGVRWQGGEQTADVDFGWPGRNLSVALPDSDPLDLHDALSTFEAGFVPASFLKGKPGASYRHKLEPDFTVDFLTVMSRARDRPRPIPALNVAAQPLRFMEFLLEAPIQSALFDPAGTTALASLPAPARYAVHKLIVHGLRTPQFRTKAAKDLAQARALIGWLRETDALALEDALRDGRRRGPSWRSKIDQGLRAVEKTLD